MTLHEAIKKVLEKENRTMTTSEIANELNCNKWYNKGDNSTITAYQIHGRAKNYPKLFKKNGTRISLINTENKQSKNINIESTNNQRTIIYYLIVILIILLFWII